MVASLGKMGTAAYYLESQKSFRADVAGGGGDAADLPGGLWTAGAGGAGDAAGMAGGEAGAGAPGAGGGMTGGGGGWPAGGGGEDYYLGGEEPDGVWWNPGGVLGLEDGGKVGTRDFQRLYNGFDPRDETPLTQNAGKENRLPGIDITFSADKSISALWGVADPEMRAVIEKAHNAAARHALDSVIREYCAWTRTKRGEAIHLVEGELVGAMFQHGTSREGDPQLHTHCCVFNAVETHQDKKWRALYRLGIGRWVKAAGAVYRHHLAEALQADLGVEIEQHGHDRAFTRVVGVPEDLTDKWSKRRIMMEREAAEEGFELGANAARAAALNKGTRKWKNDGEVTLRHGTWAEEATGYVGDVDEWISMLTGHDIEIGPEAIRETTQRIEHMPETLTRNEAVFRLPDVIERVHNATAGIFGGEATKTAFERVMRNEAVVRLDRDGDVAERMAGMAHTEVFSTRHQIEMETDVLAASERLAADPSMAVKTAAVERHLGELEAGGYQLSEEQGAAIRFAAGPAGGRLAVIEGAAGSGKSTTLRPITDIYRKAGYEVIGTAVAWRMAKQLAGDCGVTPYAVDSLLYRASRDPNLLGPKTLVIVDEAGMLGVRQAHHILRLAEERGCKILAVGDREQQQAIEAGSGLRLMHAAAGGVRVDTIRRQKADLEDVLVHVHGQSVESARYQVGLTGPAERDRNLAEYEAMPDKPEFVPWQIAASNAMRKRQAGDAIEAYHERGRFHLHRGVEETLDALVGDWEKWREANPLKTSIIMARTNEERRAISKVIRERHLEGADDDERVVVRVSSGHAENRRQMALEIVRGDILRIGGAIHREQLYNGSLVAVQDYKVARGVNGPLVEIAGIDLETGRAVRFRHDESADCFGHCRLDHGYATTLASAQGTTVDQAFLLVDELPAASSIYPAMTRHREGLDIYVNREPVAATVRAFRHEEDADEPVTDEDIRDQLALRWSREDRKALAHDFMGPELRRQFAHSVEAAGVDAAAWASNDNRAARARAAAGERVLNHAAPEAPVRAAAAGGPGGDAAAASGGGPADGPGARETAGDASPSRRKGAALPPLPSAAEVSAMLAAQVEDVCRRYLPNGKRSGGYWTAGNVEGEAGGSLYVRLDGPKRGKWTDEATQQHGDLIDLIREARDLPTITAALKEASTYLGLRSADGSEPVARREPTPEERAEAERKAAEERAEAERKGEEQAVKNKGFYEGGREIAGGGDSPAARYLAKRGLRPDDAGGLRWRDGAWVKENGKTLKFPAVLAAIETHDGKLEAVHRIFVTADGEKAPLQGSSKRNMGSPGRGGVWFGNRSAERIVMSEGIEDAMAAIRVLPEGALERMAFVATASAGRLSAVELPPTCREVVLLQDNDKAGEHAWTKLRQHHEGRGLAVSRIVARGHDVNEDLLEIGPRGLAAHLAPLTGKTGLAEYMALNREIADAIGAAGVVEGWGAIPGMKALMERAAALRGHEDLDAVEEASLEKLLDGYAKETGVAEGRTAGVAGAAEAPAEQVVAPTPAQERYGAIRAELDALVAAAGPDANWIGIEGVGALIPQVRDLRGVEGLEDGERVELDALWERIRDEIADAYVLGGLQAAVPAEAAVETVDAGIEAAGSSPGAGEARGVPAAQAEGAPARKEQAAVPAAPAVQEPHPLQLEYDRLGDALEQAMAAVPDGTSWAEDPKVNALMERVFKLRHSSGLGAERREAIEDGIREYRAEQERLMLAEVERKYGAPEAAAKREQAAGNEPKRLIGLEETLAEARRQGERIERENGHKNGHKNGHGRGGGISM